MACCGATVRVGDVPVVLVMGMWMRQDVEGGVARGMAVQRWCSARAGMDGSGERYESSLSSICSCLSFREARDGVLVARAPAVQSEWDQAIYR